MLYSVRGWIGRTAAFLLLCVPVPAQEPAFPFQIANHATGYMEWILGSEFTAGQRQQYQLMLADMWRGSQSSRDTIAAMARAHETLSRLDERRRIQMRIGKQQEFLHLLEGATDDRSRWLLSIYRAAHSAQRAEAAVPAAATQPVAGSPTLLGRWSDGYISSIQYKNAYTGVSAPTNGRSFAFDFKPDGTYSFTGLVQSVMYNCTTAMFSNETGEYAVDGDSLSLRPQKNPYQMTNNCAPSSNRESPGKLINRTYRFRTYNDGGRRYLELRGDGGSVQKFGESR